MSALESKIDDLYRQPLASFTDARNVLAKSVGGADGKQIKTLAKPTVVPWAVNQVYWHTRRLYDGLLKSGERLRKAQVAALEGKSADVRAASDAHRKAIADAVNEAERLAKEAGAAPARDALMRTFEALSLALEPPETPGRLTRELQPAGFEALAGVTPAPVVRTRPSAVPSRVPVDVTRSVPPALMRSVRLQADQQEKRDAAAKKKEDAARKKAEAEQRKREAEVRKAEAAVERARFKMRAAEQALKSARNRS